MGVTQSPEVINLCLLLMILLLVVGRRSGVVGHQVSNIPYRPGPGNAPKPIGGGPHIKPRPPGPQNPGYYFGDQQGPAA